MNELAQELESEINGNPNTGNNTKITYPDGEVWIPVGFKISDDSASTVKGGVVIEDKDLNQFVWIPVESISEYKRTAYLTDVDTKEIDSETNSTKIKCDTNYYFTEALSSDEQTSVSTYKGYYIGRYEAGDKESTAAKTLRGSGASTSNKISIKKGQAPYNFVRREQAKSLAENFGVQQGYEAKTKLVSSYAWDTAVAFIQKSVSDYASRSPQGNYSDTTGFTYTDITGKSQIKFNTVLIPTGQTTPVCNIYDMGGNVWEWTTESGPDAMERGGAFYSSFENGYVGIRDISSNNSDIGRRF